MNVQTQGSLVKFRVLGKGRGIGCHYLVHRLNEKVIEKVPLLVRDPLGKEKDICALLTANLHSWTRSHNQTKDLYLRRRWYKQ